MPGPARAALAGLGYAIALFLVGSAVGLVRVLTLEPRLGALEARMFELPLMLGIAWLISASLVATCSVTRSVSDRLIMGGVTFLCLLSAGVWVASLVGSQMDHAGPAPLPGPAGQVAAALLPLVQALVFPRRRRPLR